MAKNLIETVLNDETLQTELIDCLFTSNQSEFSTKFKCNPVDFITFLLNYLHEDVGSEKPENVENEAKNLSINKSHSYPLDLSSDLEEASTSTPKLTKINSETSFQTPISPIYRNANSFSTPNNHRRITPQKSPLVLGDFITTRRVSSSKKRTPQSEDFKRRIKPTNLNEQKMNSFHKSGNSFNFTDEGNSQPVLERSGLVEERLRILTRTPPACKLVQKIEIQPDPNLVIYKKQLDFVVRLYLGLIKGDFVLNVASEVYFLVSLLVRKQFSGFDGGICDLREKITLDDVFKSIHCIVYFSVCCLNDLRNVLITYDKSTLKLLTENDRLKRFQPDLVDFLLTNLQIEQNLVSYEDFEQNNVCFNTETDNRQNFPNEATFHAFRKQRDLFYEIIRVWEQQHLQPGFNFQSSLSVKIKTLLGLSQEPISFVHFARLFKAQLLSVSKKNVRVLDFDVDVEKLTRLTNRCISKGGETGNSEDFSENEEFFRDFIVVCGNFSFYQHLQDCFVKDIVELNATELDLANKENHVDLAWKKQFFGLLKSLIILGKFLGFLQSIPYKTDLIQSDSILKTQIDIRKMSNKNLDILSILNESINRNCVILCIPWLTKYLSMLDSITLRLPYYKQIIEVLFNLYKSFKSTKLNQYLIKFSLGWLFELGHFPNAEFFNFSTENPIKFRKKPIGLDHTDSVDHVILFYCCPHLENVKKILSTTNFNNSVTIRHITPVTALHSSTDLAKTRLEQQLEEAFFNGQPNSMRKTVDFVSERIASACVKHICTNIVPKYKKQALERWKEQIGNENNPTENVMLKSKANEFAVLILDEFQTVCFKEIEQIANERISKSIESLSSIDILPKTQMVCVEITRRLCLDRVKQWLGSHIGVGKWNRCEFDRKMMGLGVFLKDFNEEIGRDPKKGRKPTFLLPPGGSKADHVEDTASAVELVERIRDLTIEIVEQGTIEKPKFLALLNDCLKSLKERADINESITATICTQFVDLTILILSTNLELDNTTLNILFSMWKYYYNDTNDLFKSILTPRNVLILNQSLNIIETWKNFASFCVELIRNKFMSCECFEEQCTAIFRTDWDKENLEYLTGFFKEFLRKYASKSGEFSFLLDFLSDYCDDLI